MTEPAKPVPFLNRFIDFDPVVESVWTRIKPELDEWQADANRQMDEWRTDTMKMLSAALPEMAGAIAEQAVKTTFEHTQVDEAADAVSGVITGIVDRLRFPFLLGGQR